MNARNAVRDRAPARTAGGWLQMLCIAACAVAMPAGNGAAADTATELHAAAQEVGDTIKQCFRNTNPGATPPPVTNIVVTRVDPREFSKHLDDRNAARILSLFERELRDVPGLNIVGLVGRHSIYEFMQELQGGKGNEEVDEAVKRVPFNYLVVPVISAVNKDGMIMNFEVKKLDLNCKYPTREVLIRFDNTLGIVILRGRRPSEVMEDAVKLFLHEDVDIQRIAILPTANGAAVLDKTFRDSLETQLIDVIKEQARQHVGPRARYRTPEFKRLWEGELTYGEAQSGDWLAQIRFARRDVPRGELPTMQMRVAIWPRLGGNAFHGADEVYIEGLDPYLSRAVDIDLAFDAATPASRFELPRFILWVQRNVHVYCVGYTLDGEATLLLPMPRAGQTVDAGVAARSQPYRFPAEFMPGPMAPRATHPDLLHDGIVTCWTTPPPAGAVLAHSRWSEHARAFHDKLRSPAKRLPMLEPDASILIGDLRNITGVSEMIFTLGDRGPGRHGPGDHGTGDHGPGDHGPGGREP
jgi:hypothetical protein